MRNHLLLACVRMLLAAPVLFFTLGIAQCGSSGDDDDTTLPSPTPASTHLKLAIPAYFYPGALWNQSVAAAPQVGLLVANPASGPGTAPDPTYVQAIQTARDAGIEVLGYVSTRYGQRSQSEIDADVARYYQWYAVSGIFFDEGPDSSSCAGLESFYSSRAAYARQLDPSAVVVMNPGTDTCESYLDFVDILVTFESSNAAYGNWTPASWVFSHPPERFWHIVYNAPDAAAMEQAVSRARSGNVGWIDVTDDTLPNPYDTLPAYWSSELSAL